MPTRPDLQTEASAEPSEQRYRPAGAVVETIVRFDVKTRTRAVVEVVSADRGPLALADLPVVAEHGGRQDGPEPTRYGDWEKNGRCIDF